jgi:hypothetical protein
MFFIGMWRLPEIQLWSQLLAKSDARESVTRRGNIMDMESALTERIVALESIIEHLPENGRTQREYYLEKCEIYRHILADLSKGQLPPMKSSPQQYWRGL